MLAMLVDRKANQEKMASRQLFPLEKSAKGSKSLSPTQMAANTPTSFVTVKMAKLLASFQLLKMNTATPV